MILISHNLHDVFEVADNDHRAAPRPERGRVQAHGDQPAAGGRGDHRRPALQGARPVRRRCAHERRRPNRPPRSPRRAGRRDRSAPTRAAGGPTSRSGELGSLPIIVGLIIIAIVFQIAELALPHRRQLRQPDRPVGGLRADRHGHRLRPAARRDRPVGRLRVGRRAACSPRCCSPRRQRAADRRRGRSWRSRAGVAIGTFHGLLITKIGIPSFVVTLAGLLGLERRRAAADRQPRHGDPPERLRRSASPTTSCPTALAWILVVVVRRALRGRRSSRACASRRKAGLATEPLLLVGLRVGGAVRRRWRS